MLADGALVPLPMPPSPPHVRRRTSACGMGACGIRAAQRGLSTVEYVLVLVLLCAIAVGTWRVFGQTVRCALIRNGFVAELGDLPSGAEQCFEGGAIPGASAGAPLRDVAERESSSFGCSRSPSPSPTPAPSPSPSPSPTPAPSPSPSPSPTPAALTPAEQTMVDVKSILCKQDPAVLDDLRNRGVKITVYDSIYFNDPYYDGKQWTTVRTDVLGTNSGTQIQMVRTQSVEDQAGTLYHEAWHSHQPAGMSQRDQEYEAYTKSAEWRIARGLVPADFVKQDKAGKYVVDAAAIKRHVDTQYPGVTVAPAGGAKKQPEQIVGHQPNGDTIIERPDGSQYTRKPRKGDGFMSNADHPTPPAGYVVDPKLMKCP